MAAPSDFRDSAAAAAAARLVRARNECGACSLARVSQRRRLPEWSAFGSAEWRRSGRAADLSARPNGGDGGGGGLVAGRQPALASMRHSARGSGSAPFGDLLVGASRRPPANSLDSTTEMTPLETSTAPTMLLMRASER